MFRYLRLLWNTFKLVSTALLSPAGLGNIGKEQTSRVATTRGFPYQANGLLYPGGLLGNGLFYPIFYLYFYYRKQEIKMLI